MSRRQQNRHIKVDDEALTLWQPALLIGEIREF
jgi:hypothetical protein